MKTVEEIAQWVIDNRYPKSENNKVSDSEMYHELVESIVKLCTIPRVSNSVCLHEPQYQNYNRDNGLQICDKCGAITN